MKTSMVCDREARDLRHSHPAALGLHPNSFIGRFNCPAIEEDIQSCFQRLRQLVPAAAKPNARLSKVQLLQQVIDYILDLESTLDTKPTEVDKYCDALDEAVLAEEEMVKEKEEGNIVSLCKVVRPVSRQPLAERTLSVNRSTSVEQMDDPTNTNEV